MSDQSEVTTEVPVGGEIDVTTVTVEIPPASKRKVTPKSVQKPGQPVETPAIPDPLLSFGLRRLKMVRAYTGVKTSENHVYTGFYLEDDPVLHGYAEYFVENGYAEWV